MLPCFNLQVLPRFEGKGFQMSEECSDRLARTQSRCGRAGNAGRTDLSLHRVSIPKETGKMGRVVPNTSLKKNKQPGSQKPYQQPPTRVYRDES